MMCGSLGALLHKHSLMHNFHSLEISYIGIQFTSVITYDVEFTVLLCNTRIEASGVGSQTPTVIVKHYQEDIYGGVRVGAASLLLTPIMSSQTIFLCAPETQESSCSLFCKI